MANKLPWFTHDHDAREDEFICRAEDRFGHFGYAAYFKILETIHQHGVGGKLSTTRARLAKNLRSRWPQVQEYLEFCRTSGKLDFTVGGDEVVLQNKKFIERQQKYKIKSEGRSIESALKQPIQEQGHGQGHNGITDSQAAENKGFISKLTRFLAWEKRVPFKKKFGAPR